MFWNIFLNSQSDSTSRRLGRAKAFAKRAAARLTPDAIFYAAGYTHQAVSDEARITPGLRSSSDLAVRFSALDELADLLNDRCSNIVDDFVV